MKVEVGKNYLVFDTKLWRGKDVGDNSQFWKRAKVVRIYFSDDKERLADVRFSHDKRLSRGHYVNLFKAC